MGKSTKHFHIIYTIIDIDMFYSEWMMDSNLQSRGHWRPVGVVDHDLPGLVNVNKKLNGPSISTLR